MSPAESLIAVARRLSAFNFESGSPERRMVDAIERWLSADAATLDEALGLTGAPGRETARTLHRRALRDRHLVAAHGIIGAASPWRGCLALADEIARFESVIWPRWRDLPEPPPGASLLRAELFAARQFGTLPGTPMQLSRIVNNAS
ncbi:MULTISPECIES: hypothetical protein [unclassified Thiocapsa]|uniref:hypothetical protein n=1 Tax=unclassified Thiocapsa TaxID=2641286 RepID=UPI0035B0A92F